MMPSSGETQGCRPPAATTIVVGTRLAITSARKNARCAAVAVRDEAAAATQKSRQR